MYKILFAVISFLLLTRCGFKDSRSQSSLASVIEGTIPTLDGKQVYLVEAHNWKVRLDSTVVKENRFAFSIPHDSAFVPYRVSIMYSDSIAPMGINMLTIVNEYFKPVKETNYRPISNSAFYLEDEKVSLTELPRLPADSIKVWKTGASAFPRVSYPYLRVSIKAGRQTAVMYKSGLSDFGWIGKADSLKRAQMIASFKKRIADNPFAYVLLDGIYNSRGEYTEKELREILSLFSSDVKNSLKGRNFERYLDLRLDPGAALPDFVLRDPSRQYQPVLNKSATVNIMVLWASWCAPCREEIPMLREIHEYFRNRGVNLVSISIDKNETHWHKALAWEKMDWPQYIVDSTEVEKFMNQVNVQAIPAIIITDARNRELRRFVGSDSTTKQAIIDLVESQLGDAWQLK